MTVSDRRQSLTRLVAALGVDPGDFVVFGLVPIACAVVEPLVFRADLSAGGILAAALSAGTAGVVAGRRRYSVWQSAWYVLIAIVALFLWAIFMVVMVAELGIL